MAGVFFCFVFVLRLSMMMLNFLSNERVTLDGIYWKRGVGRACLVGYGLLPTEGFS